MREILFRGKRIDSGEWIEGQFLKRDGCYIAPEVNSYMVLGGRGKGRRLQFGDFYGVIPKTLGQFTGRVDKNNRRIFENHIIKLCDAGHSFFGEIKYSEKSASYWVENDRLECYAELGNIKSEFMEIVGTVEDNPELL